MAERTRDLIRQLCETRDVVIVRGAVSPDHVRVNWMVHLLTALFLVRFAYLGSH